MGGKQGRGQIYVSTPENSTVIAGESINCTAHLILNDKIKSPSLRMVFKGKEEATFQGDGVKKAKNNIIEFSETLLDPSLNLLNPGAYSFPFTIELPNDLPGTFNAKMKRFEARIEYEVKVELIERREFICKDKVFIIVEQVLGSNRQSILKTQTDRLVCCDCINKGTCNVSAHVDKHAYLPGETARLWMEVDNSKASKNLVSIGVILWRVIRLISTDKQVGLFKKSVFSTNLNVNIRANSDPLKNKDLCIDIPICSKDTNIEQCVTTIGKAVQCRYFIEISTDFGSCMSRVVEFEIPLIVAPKAIEVVLPSAPEDWNPMEMPVMNISIGPQNVSIIDRSSLSYQ